MDAQPANSDRSDGPDLVAMYRTMLMIRGFEEKARELFQSGVLPRHGHLSAGQEAVAAGVHAVLHADDYIALTHRGHGHAIARTRDFKGAFAELFGKSTGFCHGKGGSMHIADFGKAILGAFPIVGASMPVAAGGGLAARVLGNDRVSVAFFGDGASNEGAFHEALNLAAVWKLPVVFVCENNGYAIFTKQDATTSVRDIADRAAGYGIPGVVVDGMDPLAVYEAMRQAVARARAGDGPTLLEAKTYRWGGHHTGDPGTINRERAELEAWKKRDPIPKMRAKLLETGVLSEEAEKRLREEIDRQIEEAVAFGLESPVLEPKEAFGPIFAPAYVPEAPPPAGQARELTAIQALNEALREEMTRDSRLILMGEDVSVGPYGVTKDLVNQFGPGRVLDTPISELGFVAAATGASLAGVPTIAEVSFIDFMTLALDPVVNIAAKAHYMSGGQQTAPLVVRTQEGAGGGGAATHSQCLEAWFAHVPGLHVVIPSTPYDFKGLLKTAIREPNPVIFIEHKQLYRTKGPVPTGEYAIPFGVADIKRPGRDVTVIALAAMVPKALAAAEKLAQEGIEVEVIDPRTVAPLDVATLARSVSRTGRLVVAQEAYVAWGFGSEIARVVGKEAFDYLEAPIEVVGALAPIPFSPSLEAAVVPSEENVIAAVRAVLAHG